MSRVTWHCPTCGRNWIVVRRQTGIYAKPVCQSKNCDKTLLQRGAANEQSLHEVVMAQVRLVPKSMPIWVEEHVVILDLPEAISVSDEINGVWDKAPNGNWFKMNAKQFDRLIALI
jgi:hypothetical protein